MAASGRLRVGPNHSLLCLRASIIIASTLKSERINIKLMTNQNNHNIRILLIDDQTIVRQGLRMVLESEDDLVVAGEAGNPADAISLAQIEQPDIIVLDLDLGETSGIDCLDKLKEVSPNSRTLVLTGLIDTNQHLLAISTGASGVVSKLEASEVLVTAIKKVHSGEVWIGGGLMTRLINELRSLREKNDSLRASSSTHHRLPEEQEEKALIPPEENAKIITLTEREREIVALIGEGLRNQQIADRLGISVITIRHHLSSIFSKLAVSNRLELAIYAYRYKLAKLPA